ncbi:VanZ family protein [Rhodococcus sp. HM1]|nr:MULTISPECIES: VanZ family protein [unclassified Rhodococcus (in: high G+C Gram-positive bacteria)]MCK8670029.1 VanZ family protein [Rhodococcus sp. HM1]
MPTLTWRRTLPLLLATVVVTAMLLSPGGTAPEGPPHADKVTHAVFFATLAYCSLYARIPVAWTIGWLAAYGVLTEILQETIAVRRSGSVWDWCADLVGVLVGLAVFTAVRRRTRAAR